MPGTAMYARIAAVVLLGAAVAGLLAFGWKEGALFFHIGVGLLYFYVGFWLGDAQSVRLMVGGLGVLLVMVKIITILLPLGWGGPPEHGAVEITCLVVGISSILAARYLPDHRRSGRGRAS